MNHVTSDFLVLSASATADYRVTEDSDENFFFIFDTIDGIEIEINRSTQTYAALCGDYTYSVETSPTPDPVEFITHVPSGSQTVNDKIIVNTIGKSGVVGPMAIAVTVKVKNKYHEETLIQSTFTFVVC